MHATEPVPLLPLVLFAIPELASGGPDRVMAELLRDLPRDRFRFGLAVSHASGQYFDRLPADVSVHVIEGRYPVRAFAKLVDTLRPALVFTTLRMNLTAEFATWLQRHRPLLVVRQANAIAANFAALQRRSLFKHRLAHWLVKIGFRRADAVVAQSRDMADEIAPLLRTSQVLATIGNPIDIATTRRLAGEQAALNPGSLAGNPSLIGVGRLAAQKGFDLLIEALPDILAVRPEAVLTIVGTGEDHDALREQADVLGVADQVRLVGQSSSALAAIAAADLFVSSSRYEGFSNAMLEAMALDTPVAATPCPGATREMIIDGQSGMIAAAITPPAIATAVLRALAADRATLAGAANHLARQNYSSEVVVGAYAGLFDRLLAGRRHAAVGSTTYTEGVPRDLTAGAITS